ncbi:MAG: 2-phosphosulfolactate phosphatase family protein [Cyanophyceae cyanobacterium]
MTVFHLFHTPEATPDPSQAQVTTPNGAGPDCAVVIDVLRATTTIATALAAGAEAVQVFADLELLQQTGSQWPAEHRILAGERDGKAVEGFDTGNSPLDYTPERVGGRRIFMSTTNGTRALQRVATVPTVITAALINLSTVVKFLQAQSFQSVWIVGSGWQGAYALEDTVCAGAILAALQPTLGNDEAVGAVALYQQWQSDLLGLLKQASHGQRLLRLGSEYETDLRYCATTDSLTTLPIQQDPGVLVAASV